MPPSIQDIQLRSAKPCVQHPVRTDRRRALATLVGEATCDEIVAVAAEIRGELATEVARLQAEHSVTPGLAVVLVGNRPDSATYVRMKKKRSFEEKKTCDFVTALVLIKWLK